MTEPQCVTITHEKPELKAGHVHALREAFEGLLSNVRALGNSDVDDADLCDAFVAAPEQLDAISTDLTARLEICEELKRSVEDLPGVLGGITPIEAEGWTATELRRLLLDTRHIANEANQIIETVYKIVPMRASLKHVEDRTDRELMGKAMMTCGIRVDRAYEARGKLVEALRGFATLELEGDVDLSVPKDFDPRHLSGESKPERAKKEHKRSRAGSSTRTEAATSTHEPLAERCEEPSKPIISEADLRRLHAALDEWGRRRLLAPSSLSSRVSVISAEVESATQIRVEVARCGQPASRTEGNERRPQLETVEYRGRAPQELLTSAAGKDEYVASFSKADCEKLPHGPIEAIIAEASQRFDPAIVNDRIWPFFREQGEVESASLRVAPVSILHVTLSLRDRRVPNAKRVQAWLVGEEARLHVSGMPRVWTRRASAWLAGIAGVGLALGFAIAKLIV